jgi:hypothetical protein
MWVRCDVSNGHKSDAGTRAESIKNYAHLIVEWHISLEECSRHALCTRGQHPKETLEQGHSGTTKSGYGGRVVCMILIVSNEWSKHIKGWCKDPLGSGVGSSVTIKAMSQDITISDTYWPFM